MDDPARGRFFAVQMVRLGGVFLAFGGAWLAVGRGGEDARWVGAVLLVAAALLLAVVPRALIRRWRSK